MVTRADAGVPGESQLTPGGVGKPGGRRRLSVRQRRAEILAATLRLLATKPASQLSIDDIAEAAGASRALIYHYFSTKEALYVAAVRSACDELKSRLEPPQVHPFEQVLFAGNAYLDFAEEHKPEFVALLRGAARFGGQADELASIMEELRLHIVELITAGLEVENPSAVVRASLRGWVAMMEVISLDWLEHHTLTRDQVRRLLANQLGAVLVAAAVDDDELSRAFARAVATADPEHLPVWAKGLG